jgi:hypothetical protein
MKVTPSLPQRGRQPKGCIPLTPFCNLENLMKGIRNVVGCPSGGGGGETKSPKERYDLIFLSIFTEPKNRYFKKTADRQNTTSEANIPAFKREEAIDAFTHAGVSQFSARTAAMIIMISTTMIPPRYHAPHQK